MFYAYKCFNKDLTNRYGRQFEVGTTYHTDNEVTFGTNGHGFHVCHNLEDTLRYFDTDESNFVVCLVKCSGTIAAPTSIENEYYGFSPMFASEYLTIEKVLTREEIITYILSLKSDTRISNFLTTFKLTPEEITLFNNHYQDNPRILKYISYYQEGNQDAFKEPLTHKLTKTKS